MPNLFELTEIRPLLFDKGHLNLWLLCRMYAVLMYPGSDTQSSAERRRVHAAFAATVHGGILGHPPPDDEGRPRSSTLATTGDGCEAAREIVDLHLKPLGDRYALASGKSVLEYQSEMRRKALVWWRVGKIISIIRATHLHHGPSLRRGASLNKAIALVEKLHGIDRSNLMAEWTTYKSVGHLCGALFQAAVEGKVSEPSAVPELDTIPWILCAAKDYEEFGTTFTAKGGREPLVTRHSIWNVPIDSLGGWRVHIPPLDEIHLAVVTSARAPKRIH